MRIDFTAGEDLSLPSSEPRRILSTLNDHVYQIEGLRNGIVNEAHGTRLKYYRDSSWDTEEIMSLVISSETGMSVWSLMILVGLVSSSSKSTFRFQSRGETDEAVMAHIRCKRLSECENTLDPVSKVDEDAPQLLMKLLHDRNTPVVIAQEATRIAHL